MSEFKVAWNVLDSKSNEIKQYERELNECISELENIRRELRYQKCFPLSLYSYIESQKKNMYIMKNKLSTMSKTLSYAANTYKSTEQQLANGNTLSEIDKIKISKLEIGKDIFSNLYSYLEKNINDKITNLISSSVIKGISNSIFLKALNTSVLNKFNNDFFKSIKDNLSSSKFEKKEKDIYSKNKDKKFYEQGYALLSKELLNKKASAQIWNGSYSKNGKAGEFNVNATIGVAEAHSNIEAGIYSYKKDENGNLKKIFAPAINAAVGASITAFKAHTDGRLGFGDNHNMLGVYGKGDATAGKVSASGSTCVALFDKNGNINPQANANVELEAIAGELKGTAGISVLGVDAGVRGSINVGIGAHANVGYTDGVFKVDIGAAVGIGGSVGFEVDVGGAVNAVRNKAICMLKRMGW